MSNIYMQICRNRIKYRNKCSISSKVHFVILFSFLLEYLKKKKKMGKTEIC